uniref:Uncharacterized protein n=1 Tax=Arundo donax TaxID=35708 RepID=A0A0A9DG60_ARUDO
MVVSWTTAGRSPVRLTSDLEQVEVSEDGSEPDGGAAALVIHRTLCFPAASRRTRAPATTHLRGMGARSNRSCQ